MNHTVHHTCKKDGGLKYVTENAPFFSAQTSSSNPFLGSGYYFWDFNLEYAKTWGRLHYNSSYFILEAEIEVPVNEAQEVYLDLAGNRKHITLFSKLLELYKKETGINTHEDIKLSEMIEFMRKEMPPEYFPFSIIRACQHSSHTPQESKIRFNHSESYTLLKPRFIFSFKTKEDIPYLSQPKVVFCS